MDAEQTKIANAALNARPATNPEKLVSTISSETGLDPSEVRSTLAHLVREEILKGCSTPGRHAALVPGRIEVTHLWYEAGERWPHE
jgi:hypothetical protein